MFYNEIQLEDREIRLNPRIRDSFSHFHISTFIYHIHHICLKR